MTETQLIGREALIQNQVLKPLSFLVGEWKTEGTHPLVPGVTFHGRTSFAWHEGGAFLIMHSEIDEKEIPSGVATFGADGKDLFLSYFDERGVSRKYDVSVTEEGMVWKRDDQKISQCMTFTRVSDDEFVCRGRLSREGGEWEDDLSLTYTRMS